MDADRALLRRLNSFWPLTRGQAGREAAALEIERLWYVGVLAVRQSNRRVKIRAALWRATAACWFGCFLMAWLMYRFLRDAAGGFTDTLVTNIVMTIFAVGVFAVPGLAALATLVLDTPRGFLKLLEVIADAEDPILVPIPLAALYPKVWSTDGVRTPYTWRGNALDRAICRTLNRLLPLVRAQQAAGFDGNMIAALHVPLYEPGFDAELSRAAIRVLAFCGNKQSLYWVERAAGNASRDPKLHGVGKAAARILPLLRARVTEQVNADTLLRPACSDGIDTMLRPASGGEVPSEFLVRPSSAGKSTTTSDKESPAT